MMVVESTRIVIVNFSLQVKMSFEHFCLQKVTDGYISVIRNL